MSNRAVFFYRDSINIFCDTSDKEINTVYGKFKTTCAGFIATYQGRIITSGMEVFIDDDTLFGESKAVETSVYWAHVAASHNIIVSDGFSIFSDSSTTVGGICNLLFSWYDRLNAEQRMGLVQSGPKNPGVTWEDNVYNAAYSIFTSGLPIRVLYCPGHVAVYNRPFAYKKQEEKFLRVNERFHGDLSNEIDINILHDMATYNNLVDMMTRNYLFINKDTIEKDVNNFGSVVGLATGNRYFPIRWPFTSAQIPNYMHRDPPPQLLLTQNPS